MIKAFRVIDKELEDSRNNLKQVFFKSIMTTRELIRKSSFLQLKVQNKADNKATLIEKLRTGIDEEKLVLNVLQNFNETYSASKIEIERRARFDFVMVSLIRVMLGLMTHENTLRTEFLEKYAKLLPETFCPFLTNLLSTNILKQIEAYFRNDTRLNELDETVVNDILGKDCQDNLGQSPIAMKSNIEGYLNSLNSYDEVHKNLINILCGKMDINSPIKE